jgi:plastocyanin
MARPRRWLIAGLVLAGATLPGSAQAGTADVEVTMRDNAYVHADTVVGQGRTIEFQNFGRVAHDARDGSGLGLFNSPVVSAGDSATVGPLPGAGTYAYYCTFHPEMTGGLQVPVTVDHRRSPAGAAVTVRWALDRAPSGMVFDVQRRRPGTTRFELWRTGATALAARFWPVAHGSWGLRVRVRELEGGTTSGWSPTRTVRVT